MMIKHTLGLVAAAMLVHTAAATIELSSGTNAVSLLELYSSEGCSSCPPAEQWLSGLKTHPKLWKEFVPVGFHVDYWDYLGWKDPFGKAEFSERQRQHAAHWKSDSVYTPGFVLNGTEWRGWSNRRSQIGRKDHAAGVLSARSEDGKRWSVRFEPIEPTPNLAPKSLQVRAALLGFDLKSNVKAGENEGKLLQHDFVVLSLASSSITEKKSTLQGEVEFPTLDLSATKRLGVALWVTAADRLEPLQAAGGWLPATRQKQ